MSETAAKGINSILLPGGPPSPVPNFRIPIPRNNPYAVSRIQNQSTITSIALRFVTAKRMEVSYVDIATAVREAKGFHIRDGSIRNAVSWLVKKGMIYKMRRGMYGDFTATIVGVQPMPSSAGQIFTIRHTYGNQIISQPVDLGPSVSDEIMKKVAKRMTEDLDREMVKILTGSS